MFIQTRLSSLQQPPHRNTLTQGGLKKVSVLLPSSLATSTHVSRGLHWVRCHSSSITAERKLLGAGPGNGLDRPARATRLGCTRSCSCVQGRLSYKMDIFCPSLSETVFKKIKTKICAPSPVYNTFSDEEHRLWYKTTLRTPGEAG